MLLGRRLRLVVACVATTAVAGPLTWYWQASRLPSAYAVTDHGYADAGGAAHAHAGHSGRSVDALTADPARPPDVALTLTARQERFALASGRKVRGYTLNGQSPGPVIHATAGQLVQVTLVNESVPGGVALHWHGIDVPNAADGVAGVTQDAVGRGGTHTYRFVADQAGTFWYHSHQVSHAQVVGGLLGALIVSPDPAPTSSDALALVHVYDGVRTVNGQEGEVRVPAAPGERVRVRVVNTDNGRMSAWVSGAPFKLVAIDGTDVHGPTEVRDLAVPVTAGARADLEVTMPADGSGVRVHLGGSAALLLGAGAPPIPKPAAEVDPLGYGTPAALAFDPGRADRHFKYDIGRRPGFLNGKPGLWWTINGHLYPDVPMFTVAEGDVVRMRIANHSGEGHPMHLHGHHAVVLSRDGRPATGSPWWVDSLDVGNGEAYEVAFVADNPGIWMDHCHNLPHAGEGLTAHLMYEGVTTPYEVGGKTDNEPE